MYASGLCRPVGAVLKPSSTLPPATGQAGSAVTPCCVESGASLMNWSAFDLNLLVVFEAVMREQNLTRAGRRLGMSQPAVSHALARMRAMLDDELFVRTPDGMRPTPRAERMAAPVRTALQELQVTLEAEEFEPSQASRGFTIAVNNYAARAVIPPLTRRVATLSPGVVIEARPLGLVPILDQLDSGAVDLGLSELVEGGERFKCVAVMDDGYAVLLSRDHPAAAETELSLERFAALPHIVITSGGDDTGFVDERLAEHGLTRRVFARVPLLSLVLMLVGSEALAVVQTRVAAGLAAVCPLVVRPLPVASPRIALCMIWHRRLDNHPAQRWLRSVIRESIGRE